MNIETNKCLLCKNPFCTTCPAKTRVRDAIALVRENRIEQASEMLFENNPLTAITGAVCPNHLYCHGSCILSKKGNAVNFGKIERVISRDYLHALATMTREELISKLKIPTPKNDKKVLIAGSGPASLALALYLTKNGTRVSIYEKKEKFGGMLRYGIPDFRLDKSLIDDLVTVLTNIGVEFKANTEVDIHNTKKYSEFSALVLAIGAGVSRKLNIEGSDLPHVTYALDYLANPTYAKNVVVIGGGNVAIDCALTASHLNADSTHLCYRKSLSDMKAYDEELDLAKKASVQFEFHMSPKRIVREGAVFERDNAEVLMRADRVIIAIGQSATENGNLNPETYKDHTSPRVYPLADAVTGTNTIIKAVAAAQELATSLAN